MMVKPSKLPYQPKPVLPPARKFIKPFQQVVPEGGDYKSPADRFEKLLKKQDLPGGRPGEYGPPKDKGSSPYLDDKGNLKKGYMKTYIKGQLYYQHKKTGKTYPA